MEKKETTPRRVARRSYEERNKDKRKQTSGNFGTMIPRDLYVEINAFLKERNLTKVDFIKRDILNLYKDWVKNNNKQTRLLLGNETPEQLRTIGFNPVPYYKIN